MTKLVKGEPFFLSNTIHFGQDHSQGVVYLDVKLITLYQGD